MNRKQWVRMVGVAVAGVGLWTSAQMIGGIENAVQTIKNVVITKDGLPGSEVILDINVQDEERRKLMGNSDDTIYLKTGAIKNGTIALEDINWAGFFAENGTGCKFAEAVQGVDVPNGKGVANCKNIAGYWKPVKGATKNGAIYYPKKVAIGSSAENCNEGEKCVDGVKPITNEDFGKVNLGGKEEDVQFLVTNQNNSTMTVQGNVKVGKELIFSTDNSGNLLVDSPKLAIQTPSLVLGGTGDVFADAKLSIHAPVQSHNLAIRRANHTFAVDVHDDSSTIHTTAGNRFYIGNPYMNRSPLQKGLIASMISAVYAQGNSALGNTAVVIGSGANPFPNARLTVGGKLATRGIGYEGGLRLSPQSAQVIGAATGHRLLSINTGGNVVTRSYYEGYSNGIQDSFTISPNTPIIFLLDNSGSAEVSNDIIRAKLTEFKNSLKLGGRKGKDITVLDGDYTISNSAGDDKYYTYLNEYKNEKYCKKRFSECKIQISERTKTCEAPAIKTTKNELCGTDSETYEDQYCLRGYCVLGDDNYAWTYTGSDSHTYCRDGVRIDNGEKCECDSRWITIDYSVCDFNDQGECVNSKEGVTCEVDYDDNYQSESLKERYIGQIYYALRHKVPDYKNYLVVNFINESKGSRWSEGYYEGSSMKDHYEHDYDALSGYLADTDKSVQLISYNIPTHISDLTFKDTCKEIYLQFGMWSDKNNPNDFGLLDPNGLCQRFSDRTKGYSIDRDLQSISEGLKKGTIITCPVDDIKGLLTKENAFRYSGTDLYALFYYVAPRDCYGKIYDLYPLFDQLPVLRRDDFIDPAQMLNMPGDRRLNKISGLKMAINNQFEEPCTPSDGNPKVTCDVGRGGKEGDRNPYSINGTGFVESLKKLIKIDYSSLPTSNCVYDSDSLEYTKCTVSIQFKEAVTLSGVDGWTNSDGRKKWTKTYHKTGYQNIQVVPVDTKSLPYTIDFTIDKIGTKKTSPNFGGLSADDLKTMKNALASFSGASKTVNLPGSGYTATLTKKSDRILIDYRCSSSTSCTDGSEEVAISQ